MAEQIYKQRRHQHHEQQTMPDGAAEAQGAERDAAFKSHQDDITQQVGETLSHIDIALWGHEQPAE